PRNKNRERTISASKRAVSPASEIQQNSELETAREAEIGLGDVRLERPGLLLLVRVLVARDVEHDRRDAGRSRDAEAHVGEQRQALALVCGGLRGLRVEVALLLERQAAQDGAREQAGTGHTRGNPDGHHAVTR